MGQKVVWSKKNCLVKKILGQNNFLGQKTFWFEKIFGSKIFWVKKFWVRKKFGSKNFLGKKCLGSKKFGSKRFGSEFFFLLKKTGRVNPRGRIYCFNLMFRLNDSI